MKRNSLFAIGISILGAVVFLAIVVTVSAGFQSPESPNYLEVIATGLDSPRHLTFGPDGALYVAEAGVGGTGPCIPVFDTEACAGDSGAITRIEGGSQQQVVTGLVSIAGDPGPGGILEAIGPHDVLFDDSGTMYVLTGLGNTPTHTVPATGTLYGLPFASILKEGTGGTMDVVADIGAYELSDNPDGGALDTNPFTFVQDVTGTIFVADAGGNSLLSVDGSTISTTAVFPTVLVNFFEDFPTNTMPISIPMQAVPTSVDIGPDGDLYVGQLTGYPFPPGGASVYHIPKGGSPEVYKAGFTNIVDIEFDDAGNLYVLEMATHGLLAGFGLGDWTGALKRIDPDGNVTTVASDGLVAPTGMTVGDDGWIYISNKGVFPGEGEVVRVPAYNELFFPLIFSEAQADDS